MGLALNLNCFVVLSGTPRDFSSNFASMDGVMPNKSLDWAAGKTLAGHAWDCIPLNLIRTEAGNLVVFDYNLQMNIRLVWKNYAHEVCCSGFQSIHVGPRS